MDPWYKITTPRKEIGEGRSFTGLLGHKWGQGGGLLRCCRSDIRGRHKHRAGGSRCRFRGQRLGPAEWAGGAVDRCGLAVCWKQGYQGVRSAEPVQEAVPVRDLLLRAAKLPPLPGGPHVMYRGGKACPILNKTGLTRTPLRTGVRTID